MSNQVLGGFLGEDEDMEDIAEDIDIAEDKLEGESSESKSFKSDDIKRDSGTPSGSSVGSSTPTISPEPEDKGAKEFLRQNQQKMQYLIEDYIPPAKKSSHDLTHTYCWNTQLADPSFVAAPVSTFAHAPMADGWDNIMVDMKVEVENSDADPIPGVFNTAFWVATVLRISGYKVLLRYEGFGQDGTKDFWMNLCSEKVHPVGWCATKGKPLIPPKTIQAKYTDWKDFLVKRLTGARTLPTNFYKVVWESVGSVFKKGMKLEVVDKMRISQVRVATVVDITGRRLQLAYDDTEGTESDGFWCHEESPLIHPVGWARKVGHQIAATPDYHDRCLMETYLETDSTPDMFPEYRQPAGSFKAGQKLEAVDPLNLATICVATVMKVLRHGYIMIRMDGYETDPTGGDWFCYHGSSPFVFPPGFCDRNNIKLKVPAGFDGDFLWMDYLKSTKSESAPMSLFSHKDACKHTFKPGMKVECTDLMDPRLVCVGTISRVVGRLLKVHFDGWEEDYDQWMDCESVDMYPVGWCELVGHRLEGPRMKMPIKKERKRKQNPKKAVGKARKKGTGTSPGDVEEGYGDLESRSPTPTPPVLEPEVPPKPEPVKEEEVKQEMPVVTPAEVIEAKKEEAQTTEVKEDIKVVTISAPTSAPIAYVTPTMAPVAEPIPEEDVEDKYIPRLLDAAGNVTPRSRDQHLEPADWSVKNVTSFLEVNECSNLVHNFVEKEVDGVKFLTLTKQEIMTLVNNKMGPCLKVEHLQKLLKDRLNPAQARLLASFQKK
eukprot:TRINITY_DN53588_c0_g1_i1.p1 TRINITY_DN53588_c0_g1~~TRINITY_DN53588_c0_g1_i1.p1  ORF type:complete len:772 (-),score=281.52 TRINITY_DN53588_c0_g1_i1:542-2857(-)